MLPDSVDEQATAPSRAGLTFVGPAGGAIMFDYRVHHRGLANASGSARPLLYFTYAKPWFDDVTNYRNCGSIFDFHIDADAGVAMEAAVNAGADVEAGVRAGASVSLGSSGARVGASAGAGAVAGASDTAGADAGGVSAAGGVCDHDDIDAVD
eukprot:g7638.t1